MPPGMNGAEATKQIRKLYDEHLESSFIVCLTAQKLGDFTFENDMVFFDDIQQKPLSLDSIKALITRANNSKHYKNNLSPSKRNTLKIEILNESSD